MDGAEVVKLKVGDNLFETTKGTLLGSPFFEGFFSEATGTQVDEDGVYYVDADGDQFQHVLSYLRHGQFPLLWSKGNGFNFEAYARLAIQADFFQIDRLKDWIEKQEYKSAIIQTKSVTIQVVEEPNQNTVLTSAPEARIIFTHISSRKRYICPRDILSHHDNPRGCGRQCHNAQSVGGPQYDDVPILMTSMETEDIKLNLNKLADDSAEM